MMFKKGLLLVLIIILGGVILNKYYAPNNLGLSNSNGLKSYETEFISFKSPKPNDLKKSNLSRGLRDELLELLKGRSFVKLDELIEGYANLYDQDAISEHEFDSIFIFMSVIDPTLEPLFMEWVDTTGSWSANFAASRYLDEIAWEWRGGSFSNLVPEENFSKFKELQSKVVLFHERAKQNNNRDSLWHADRIKYANERSDPLEEKYIEEALDAFPQSHQIYFSAIHAQQVRWGGDEFRRQELIYDFIAVIEGDNVGESASSNYFFAVNAEKEKDYVAASRYMNKAIELNPNRLGYYSSLARYYEKLDRYPEAIALLTTVIENTREGNSSQKQRARIYANSDEFELAKKDLDSFLKYNPYDRSGNVALVEIYSVLGDLDGVMSAIERGSYFTQKDPRQWVRLAYYPRYTLKNEKLAEELYLKAFALSEFQVGTNYNLATLYGGQQNCKIVKHLNNYLYGCNARVGDARKWCKSQYRGWALSSVNFLKGNNKCPEINDLDFSSYR